jgi:hypothetical protein
MKQPSTLYVGQVLREKKLFDSKLNDKNPQNWNDANYSEWANIIGEKIERVHKVSKRKMYVKTGIKRNGKKKVQVMRMSDGKIFESVTQCIQQERFYKVLMEHLLREGISYKRVKI